jgi:hypothetical protein
MRDLNEHANAWKIEVCTFFGQECKVAQRTPGPVFPDISLAYDYTVYGANSGVGDKFVLMLDNVIVPTDAADAALLVAHLRLLAKQQELENKRQQELKINAAVEKFIAAVKGAT